MKTAVAQEERTFLTCYWSREILKPWLGDTCYVPFLTRVEFSTPSYNLLNALEQIGYRQKPNWKWDLN
jgi:hypothetical protein